MNKTDGIVLSTRVRLARNLTDLPFPGRFSQAQAEELINRVEKAFSPAAGEQTLRLLRLEDTTRVLAGSLAERHLLSPEFLKAPWPAAALLSEDETLCVMVGEEDHIRIQVILPGFQLDACLETAVKADTLLEKSLPVAFSDTLGFLTACPTNLGTGLRASVMLHLPALLETGAMKGVAAAAAQMGLTVRGLYGEGSPALGSVFQVSNQITLGPSEAEILARLKDTAEKIIEQEIALRAALRKADPDAFADRIERARGLLQNARLLTLDEAMEALSLIRLGVTEGLLNGPDPMALQKLTERIGASALSLDAGHVLSPRERDLCRAQLCKEALS